MNYSVVLGRHCRMVIDKCASRNWIHHQSARRLLNMRTFIHRVALVLATCAWCDLLSASDVSFLQSPLGGAEGLFSDPAEEEVADNFLFAAKTKVNSLRWWGTYFTSVAEPDHFTIRFFSHQTSTGRPEAQPHQSIYEPCCQPQQQRSGRLLWGHDLPVSSTVDISRCVCRRFDLLSFGA